ncbi:hypothetical protein HCB46_08115 [Listeria ivanovii]|uniref:hypothetical protein n=1 Tax=Listeria ivanovii TaxID=1638 RepID=UPI00162A722D|nr:hypothetical protein [Listeria ivanovii]MBC2255432.1 hypothetical protein [Listeria ivanovii]
MKETKVTPIGMGILNKENILEFLLSFKKRTGMYVKQPDNYELVTEFLRGYMYCCYLQGLKCMPDYNSSSNDITEYIDSLIQNVESSHFKN